MVAMKTVREMTLYLSVWLAVLVGTVPASSAAVATAGDQAGAQANSTAESTDIIATIVNGTDIYPANDGKSESFCSMAAKDTAKLLATKAGENRWLRVVGMTGACGGKTGWVWKGDNGEDVVLH